MKCILANLKSLGVMNNKISQETGGNDYITAGAVSDFILMETMYQNLGLTNMSEDVRYIINHLNLQKLLCVLRV